MFYLTSSNKRVEQCVNVPFPVGYLSQFLLGMYKAGLSEPLLHFNLFCDQLWTRGVNRGMQIPRSVLFFSPNPSIRQNFV